MSATPANPVIVECELPLQTSLDCDFVNSAYFFDSYRTLLTQPSLRMVDIFFALFGHHPLWMKSALILRHRLVSLFGLDAPKSSEVMKFERKSDYAVGDLIGVWPIFVLNETELIAGGNNKHLDFRLSILKESAGPSATAVVLSTICVVHNWFGKAYLFVVIPFHRWGLRLLISRAVQAGRL